MEKSLEEKRAILAELREITKADKCPGGSENVKFGKMMFSPKQKRFLAYRLQGHTLAESAEKAGYKCKSKERFAETGFKVWKKMKSNELVLAAFEAVGITPEEIALKMKELMNCNTVVRVSEGVTQVVPDNTNRNKALQTVLEVTGGFAPKQETVTVQTFEQKIEMVQEIKDNPELLDSLKQRLIEIRREKGASSG